MRVNVYAEELTDRIELVTKEINGTKFTAIRFYLELPVTIKQNHGGVTQYKGPFQHHEGDDDSAAVTFWGKRDLRPMLQKALSLLNNHYADRLLKVDHLLNTGDQSLESILQSAGIDTEVAADRVMQAVKTYERLRELSNQDLVDVTLDNLTEHVECSTYEAMITEICTRLDPTWGERAEKEDQDKTKAN